MALGHISRINLELITFSYAIPDDTSLSFADSESTEYESLFQESTVASCNYEIHMNDVNTMATIVEQKYNNNFEKSIESNLNSSYMDYVPSKNSTDSTRLITTNRINTIQGSYHNGEPISDGNFLSLLLLYQMTND